MTITQEQYWQLTGLLTLARLHNRDMKFIERAMLAITKEEDTLGHTCDAAYNDYTVDELLERLSITVDNDKSLEAEEGSLA